MAIAYLLDQPSPRIMRYREARSVPCAGDLVDVFTCAQEQVNIVVADVSGRDVQAQRYAQYLRHVVRMLADGHSPGGLLECANVAFHRHTNDYGDDRFASLFVATLKGERLTYGSAGHGFAFLVPANGRHRHLPPTGMLLGIDDAERYQERTLAVAPGDWLILVTDGVTDARDAKGTFFGTRRVVRNALSAIEAGLDDPAARILEAARRHTRRRFVDDASVLCVRFF